ncbi:hypothetical protein [Enterococcus hirae]|uniref:hypothetical protein n=1 Tax=Enterococcus hirae TaxID=1354 RepID=UPI003CF149EC
MEKQNTQELRSVSDGQKNTLDKDQSKMIDAELVGLLEGRVKQKSEKAIYSTIIQSQSSSSEWTSRHYYKCHARDKTQY